jgi:hypothetical protein
MIPRFDYFPAGLCSLLYILFFVFSRLGVSAVTLSGQTSCHGVAPQTMKMGPADCGWFGARHSCRFSGLRWGGEGHRRHPGTTNVDAAWMPRSSLYRARGALHFLVRLHVPRGMKSEPYGF